MSTVTIVIIAVAAGFACGVIATGLYLLYWAVRCWMAGLEELD
jgi:hypothetical protein